MFTQCKCAQYMTFPLLSPADVDVTVRYCTERVITQVLTL